MEKNCSYKLNVNEGMFNDLFDEYDYEIMLAKDNAVAKVLREISKYLYSTYTGLSKEGKTMISTDEESHYDGISPLLYAEIIDTDKCSYLRTDYMPSIYLPDFKVIKITGEVYTDINEEQKTFEYEVVFNNDLSLIIIQDQDNVLILDLIEDFIMDNTYSDDETTAVLCTLAFVVSGFKGIKSNVISLCDYKRRKNIK